MIRFSDYITNQEYRALRWSIWRAEEWKNHLDKMSYPCNPNMIEKRAALALRAMEKIRRSRAR